MPKVASTKTKKDTNKKSVSTSKNKSGIKKKTTPKKSVSKKDTSTKTKISTKEQFVPVKIKRLRDKKDAHHHVITGSIDNKYISVGLTTKPKKGKGNSNIKLKADPLGTKEDSFMKKQGTVERQKAYFDPKEGHMTVNDFSKAEKIGKKAKEKHIRKQEEKKAKKK